MSIGEPSERVFPNPLSFFPISLDIQHNSFTKVTRTTVAVVYKVVGSKGTDSGLMASSSHESISGVNLRMDTRDGTAVNNERADARAEYDRRDKGWRDNRVAMERRWERRRDKTSDDYRWCLSDTLRSPPRDGLEKTLVYTPQDQSVNKKIVL